MRATYYLLPPRRISLLFLRLHLFRERPQRLVHVVETLLPFGAGHECENGGVGGRGERSAERAVASGRSVELEPMTAVERKVVHVCLKDYAGVVTRSEGTEPNRFVVIDPV